MAKSVKTTNGHANGKNGKNGRLTELEEVTLQQVEAYRRMYALCDISPVTKRLKVSHYVTCLVSGRTPLWGMFSAETGKLMFFFDSREHIEGHPNYARKAWRVRQAAWMVNTVRQDMDGSEKRELIKKQKKAA